MNFLGRFPPEPVEGSADPYPVVPTPYPGVAIFFLPELAQSRSKEIDSTKLKVKIDHSCNS